MYSVAVSGITDSPKAAHRLDLSRLYKSCIFRSEARTNSHPPLAKLLSNPHQVQWGPGTVDSALFGVDARRLKLMVLRYGPQVEIEPQPFSDFVLVQMPLRGSMKIRQGANTRQVTVGQVAIIGQNKGVRLTWSEDCEQIIIRVPQCMLKELAHHATPDNAAVPSFAGIRLLDDNSNSEWSSLTQALLDSLLPKPEHSHVVKHPAWVEQMERSLALFTLLQMQADTIRVPTPLEPVQQVTTDTSTPAFPNDSAYRMHLVQQYAMKRLFAPLSLEDLAKAAGVRPRTMYMDCVRYSGVGPTVWLRGLRLDAARERILGNPNCNVTDIAMDCGFGHLGRFSAYYRERFGELPSETAKTSPISKLN